MLKLTDYIDYTVVKDRQFPKNLEFFCIDQDSKFEKPGIFYLYFRGELIYIGFTNNNQHVIQQRIIRQIATITLRDHRIVFTKQAPKTLYGNQVLNTYFTSPKPVIGRKDFVTSVNRIAFAAYHWDEFKNLNKETLGRFEFEWHPNPKLGAKPNIEALCNELKKKFKPRCNKEYDRPKFK
jgi:hypothetical protein